MVTAKRNPLLAGFFSLIVPGLGQVYNGELRKGIIFFITTYLFLIIFSLTGLYLSFSGLLFAILIILNWRLFIIIDSTRIAKSQQSTELSRYNRWYVYLLIIIVVIIIDPTRNIISVRSYYIPAGSMEPMLLVGDYLIVNKFNYAILNPFTNNPLISLKKPQRNDLAVFLYPQNPDKEYIKRIIGLPGDQIQIIDKRLYLNGQLSEFPVLSDNLYEARPVYRDWQVTTTPRDNFGPVVVPQGAYFVMGDNRDYSYDSRFWGFVPAANLRGKATYIYFSRNPDDSRIRWNRIGQLLD